MVTSVRIELMGAGLIGREHASLLVRHPETAFAAIVVAQFESAACMLRRPVLEY